MRYKVLINWYGEVLTFYTHSGGEERAVSNAIRQLAKKIERKPKSVRDYVMDANHQRWEVK